MFFPLFILQNISCTRKVSQAVKQKLPPLLQHAYKRRKCHLQDNTEIIRGRIFVIASGTHRLRHAFPGLLQLRENSPHRPGEKIRAEPENFTAVYLTITNTSLSPDPSHCLCLYVSPPPPLDPLHCRARPVGR